MKQFRFKLSPVLKLRQYRERLAQQETARAQRDVKNSARRIDQLGRERRDQARAMEQVVRDGIPAPLFNQYYQYLSAVEHDILLEAQKKKGLEQVLVEKLEELRKKSVDKKAMELYREKRKEQYLQEISLAEQKELDEVSILKTARKKAQ